MERGAILRYSNILLVFVLLLGIAWGALPTPVGADETEGFFLGSLGNEFTWPSRLPVHLPAVGRAIGGDELGYTYVWEWEIAANEWNVNVPGFNFGVSAVPLATVVHELGQLPDEWAYRGSTGERFSNNVATEWGRPIGDVGDRLRFVYDTAAGSLWLYSRLSGEAGKAPRMLVGELLFVLRHAAMHQSAA